MITAQCHVGILLELHFQGSPTLDEVDAFKAETGALVARVAAETGKRVVLCTDLRDTELFAPETTERIIDLMRKENPRVARNGVLGNEGDLLTLQCERMLIEATKPGGRKVFTRPDRLCDWLDPLLTDAERARLRDFLRWTGARPAP
jgi:hypothetical protein